MAETEAPPDSEYEREPVPEKAWLGLRSYVGQFAGEHVAGTELMIGPLFLAAGVSAFDFFAGLLVGNLLAVLSWVFFTAPIATRVRLTLYCHLEKICGRKLVVVYNAVNGVMFTVLAGAMMTVSATVLGVFFPFSMPQLSDTLPTGIGWIVAVLLTGALFSAVAAKGYRFVAAFANAVSPLMVLMFALFGFLSLRKLGVTGLADFWEIDLAGRFALPLPVFALGPGAMQRQQDGVPVAGLQVPQLVALVVLVRHLVLALGLLARLGVVARERGAHRPHVAVAAVHGEGLHDADVAARGRELEGVVQPPREPDAEAAALGEEALLEHLRLRALRDVVVLVVDLAVVAFDRA